MAELKLVDGAGRNILRGSTDRLITDIDTVHGDAGGAAKAATERDGGVPCLRGIKVLPVLDLDTRLELGEIEEVPATQWEVLNLVCIDNPLHCRLLGVDSYGVRLHLDNLAFLAELQLAIDSRRVTNQHSCGRA